MNPYINVNLQAVAKIVSEENIILSGRFASIDGSKTHVPRFSLAGREAKRG